MKKSIVWAAAVMLIGSCVFIYACNSGNNSNTAGSGNPLRVLAKNVIFGSSTANAATTQRAGGQVDTTTQVLAENVVIDNAKRLNF